MRWRGWGKRTREKDGEKPCPKAEEAPAAEASAPAAAEAPAADSREFITAEEIMGLVIPGSRGESGPLYKEGVPRDRQERYKKILEALLFGGQKEAEGDLEAAYAHYQTAADFGCVDAMRMIGNLYFHQKFRPVTVSAEENMVRRMLTQGQKVFMPWDMMETQEPDVKTAFAWYVRAGDHGDVDGLHNAGVMLLRGVGCQKDIQRGKDYLRRAVERGNALSVAVYKEFFGEEDLDISYLPDGEYFALLKEFARKADQNDPAAMELLNALRIGTPRQLTRLGYVIAKGRYNTGGIYEKTNGPERETGEAYGPVYFYNRSNWESYVKIDLDAFEEEEVELSVACDLRYLKISPARWMKEEGTIEYTSGAFGFLGERKKGIRLRINKDYGDTYGSLEALPFDPAMEREIAASNATFFSENGEKEYSVEICQIIKGKPVILCRYSIDKYGLGFDQGDRASQAEMVREA